MIQANCWHQRRLWLKLWVSLLGEGVHVLGESVDYLWIAEDNSGFKSRLSLGDVSQGWASSFL